MKLSKLYANRSDVFQAVKFTDGISVVMAEIRHPEDKELDSHSLGKTKLGELINFCLLLKKSPTFFLFKNAQFEDFVFYLEITLFDGSYITLRRSVSESSKISFVKHDEKNQDYSNSPGMKWDHESVPFDRAKSILDAALDLQASKPWDFRKGIGYLLSLIHI